MPIPRPARIVSPLLPHARAFEERLRRFEDFVLVPSQEQPPAPLGAPSPLPALRRLELPEADREDALAFARGLEECARGLEAVCAEARLFSTAVESPVREAAAVLRGTGSELTAALRDPGSDEGLRRLTNAKRGFSRVEGLCREGLSGLLRREDVVEPLKLREFYRRLSDAAARGADAVDALNRLLTRNS